MNYIIIFILSIIVLIVLYLSYKYFNRNREDFTNISNIRDKIIDNKKNELITSGTLKYNGSLFDRHNGHSFVFKNQENKLQGLGPSSILNNIYTEELSNDAKLYHNHESFCLLKNGNVHAFGKEESGGVIPQEKIVEMRGKTIVNVFSTESAFCALDEDKMVYCWGNESAGGVINDSVKDDIRNKPVKKMFTSKYNFAAVYTEDSLNDKLTVWGRGKIFTTTAFPKDSVINIYFNDKVSIIILYKNDDDILKVGIFLIGEGNDILNRNKLHEKDNVKCVYTNEDSILILYGDKNKIAACGNSSYYGDKDELEQLEYIVSVVSNMGAYTFLKYDGTIYSQGINAYISGFPTDNTDFKNIYSSKGAFVGIKNDNTAVIWGRSTHGYNDTNTDNNTISNVKDVYFNGDSSGGSVLLVKNGNSNIELRGNSDYWGGSNITLASDSVSRVFSNEGAFFIITTENRLLVYGKEAFLSSYDNNNPLELPQTGVYTNDIDLETKFGFDFENDFENFLSHLNSGYPDDDEEESQSTTSTSTDSATTATLTTSTMTTATTEATSITTTVSQDEETSNTTSTTDLQDDNIYSYYWSLSNTPSVVTNHSVSWNVNNDSALTYDIIEGEICAKIDEDDNVISFTNKKLNSDKMFLGFSIYVNDLQKNYNVLILGKLIIQVNNERLELIKDDTLVRIINVTKTFTTIGINMNKSNIRVYINGSEISYNTLTPDIFDGDTVPFRIGSTSSDLDSPDFYIKDLIIYDNYELTDKQILQIVLNPDSTIFSETTQVVQETNAVFTTQAPVQVPLITLPILGRKNYIVIRVLTNSNNLTLKTKRHENFNFIKGQKQNNLSKITRMHNSIRSYNKNFNFVKEFLVRKVENVKYRGLEFTNNVYTNISSSYVNILFKLDNDSLTRIMKLKYLDVSTIYNIHNNNKKNGSIYIFINGVKTNKLSVVNEAKQTIYFIIYKDVDLIYRFEQIKVDLTYFYKIFNKKFTEMYVNIGLPNNINQNFIDQFYDNLEENNIKDYKEILFIENNDKDIFKSINANIYVNNSRTNFITLFNSKKVNDIQCSFNPIGNTLFECKQLCLNDSINNNCDDAQCNNLCNQCSKDDCKWNYTKKMNELIFRPDKTRIKGFSGNGMIKVTWIKPTSKSTLLKYYIILTTPSNPDFIEVFSFEDERELPEYIIDSLDNEKRYHVGLVSKNQMGVSDISNIETIVPNVGNDFAVQSRNSYDNSLQNFTDNNGNNISLRSHKSIYEKHTIINDLKNIIKDDLKIDKPIGAYTINIY